MYSLSVDPQSMKMFETAGINVELLLKEAGIPFRAVQNQKFTLSHDQYKGLVFGMEKYFEEESIIAFSSVESMATFVPEFFAGLCSVNGLTCIKRVSKYKRIIAPTEMSVSEEGNKVKVSYCFNDGESMPRMFILHAQIAILSLIRTGTGLKDLSPLEFIGEYDYSEAVEKFIGVPIRKGETNSLVFDKADLLRPFITENNMMWSYLEPELNQRVAEMDQDRSFSATVRRTLTDLIPGGVSDADQVSHELGVSKRTLQRRLKEEKTTFNQQLNHTRELMVRNCLKMNMTLDEIAFMVNYSDAKSLSRAFKVWTGKSVRDYRKQYC